MTLYRYDPSFFSNKRRHTRSLCHWSSDVCSSDLPPRSYSPEYVPFNWRHWWAFGGGALADFGCHYMDLPHWALGLRTPSSAEVVEGPPVHPESTPPWLIARYEYPARESKPAVTLTWYHGGKHPQPPV